MGQAVLLAAAVEVLAAGAAAGVESVFVAAGLLSAGLPSLLDEEDALFARLSVL